MELQDKKSQALYEEACRYIPGGVNSPVRAFKAVGGNPVFISRAAGPYLYDADGKEYIDYVCSWGALVLGHAYPAVVEKLHEAVSNGTSYGAPTERETILARMVTEAFPAVEKIRFVNSGTEATMSALRLARAYTGRSKIIKFKGCYHGHADSLLVQAGSGGLTFGVPNSPGVTSQTAENTIVVNYNDIQAVEDIFVQDGSDIAAVIVEPVAGNMGLIMPKEGFLEGLRKLTQEYKALLIFDEVMTGFRVSLGGAQEVYGIEPDLTCLGKIIGGGLPVGAFGGKAEIMEMLAPSGPVYQAGTLSGNPLAMAAGIATLQELNKPGFYDELDVKGSYLVKELAVLAKNAGIPFVGENIGGMFGFFFTEREVFDLCHQAGFTPRILCRSNDVRTVLLWASTGLGIGIVPKNCIGLIPDAKLTYKEIYEPSLSIGTAIVWMKNRYLSSVAKNFLDTFKD